MAELDPLTIISVLANALLVIIIAYQLKTYRNEIKNRQRPWISRQNRPDSIKMIQAKEGGRLFFNMINNGELPALDMKIQVLIAQQQPGIDTEPPYTINEERPIALGPKETWQHRVDLNAQDYQIFQNGMLWYAFKITYSAKNKIKGVYEIRGHFERQEDVFDWIDIK
jgi:hypothetical protein